MTICKTCTKEVRFSWPCTAEEYAWKRVKKNNVGHHYFCSYGCMRKFDKIIRRRSNAKRIRCVELDKTFDSVRQAADSTYQMTGIPCYQSITKVAREGRGTAAGYHWEYVEGGAEND